MVYIFLNWSSSWDGFSVEDIEVTDSKVVVERISSISKSGLTLKSGSFVEEILVLVVVTIVVGNSEEVDVVVEVVEIVVGHVAQNCSGDISFVASDEISFIMVVDIGVVVGSVLPSITSFVELVVVGIVTLFSSGMVVIFGDNVVDDEDCPSVMVLSVVALVVGAKGEDSVTINSVVAPIVVVLGIGFNCSISPSASAIF